MIENVHRPPVPIEKRPSITLFFFRTVRAALLLASTMLLVPFLCLVLVLMLAAAYADEAIDGKIEERS